MSLELKPKKLHFTDQWYEGVYKDYLYKGPRSLFFKINHHLMDLFIDQKSNSRCLDIGGGALQHIEYMSKKYVKEYATYDYEYLREACAPSSSNKESTEIKYKFFSVENERELVNQKGKFTRIIASHVLEHLEKPEEALLKWVELLSDDGIISISVPADPGFMWKIGQLISYRKFSKLNKCTYKDFEMHNAREHINSAQRITRIVDYYFRAKKSYGFPAVFPFINSNLFIFFQLKKADFDYTKIEKIIT